MARCSSCGADLAPGGAVRDLCPGCLLRLAVDQDPDVLAEPSPACELPKIIAPIGRGPDGITYVAQRPGESPTFVTVKMIESTLDGERFRGSIQDLRDRLCRASVAGVATLLGAGITDDLRVFVLAEYVRGSEFASFFGESHTHTAQRLRVMQMLAATVSALHEHGILHGALKPSNVIVTAGNAGPAPVLLDVGVRRAITSARFPPPRATGTSIRAESLEAARAADLRDLHALVLRALDASPTSSAQRLRRRLDGRNSAYLSASEFARDLAGLVT